MCKKAANKCVRHLQLVPSVLHKMRGKKSDHDNAVQEDKRLPQRWQV